MENKYSGCMKTAKKLGDAFFDAMHENEADPATVNRAITSLLGAFIETNMKGDLEVAREFLDMNKSKILNVLSEKGWC